MSCKVPSGELFAIDVPVIVNNNERLIEMLGGVDEIFYVFEAEKRRLKLTFRPNMVYSKPVCGDPVKVTALLLRVQKFRNRHTEEVLLVPTVIGRVTRMYKFDSLVDFQFGPYERVSTTGPNLSSESESVDKYRVFYDDLILRSPTTVLDTHLSRNVPLFLPPMLFSRQDVPFNYGFASPFRSSEYVQLEEKIHRLPTARKSRPGYAFIIGLEDPIPVAPRASILEAMPLLAPEEKELYSVVEELFTKRPIWLRNAVAHHSKCVAASAVLKRALPRIAYYMPRGPWGRGWVRFGYDPRIDPASRFYQVIDFRIKSHVLIRKILERNAILKSSGTTANVIRYNRFHRRRRVPGLHWLGVDISEEPEADRGSDLIFGDDDEFEINIPKTSDFTFSRAHLPNSQQLMVSLADIEISEVQSIIAETPQRTTFDPVDGWLRPGGMARIRELMAEHLQLWLDEELHD